MAGYQKLLIVGHKVGILFEELGIDYDAHGKLIIGSLTPFSFHNHSLDLPSDKYHGRGTIYEWICQRKSKL